ncbi:hypothetical protein HZB02_06065 [Candidatus Woesearchaeota archaeon]|nr:hypothetical protein [Candidatus Woesearchaeota archaeon]
MPEQSVFRDAITFFDKIGIYDVVLPFLLVFTIMFAILEKTKVFGMEQIDGHDYTKKNLNAMTAFVTAFVVVASSRIVALINEALANVVVLLIISVCFLLLIGSFYGKDDEVALKDGWKKLFMGLMFAGIILIFLHAAKLSDGTSWLEWMYWQVAYNFDSTAVGALVLMIIIIALMFYIIKGNGPAAKGGKEEKNGSH